MKRETIIQAWKDPVFRASLSAEERATLPACPAGQSLTELAPEELAGVTGGVPVLQRLEIRHTQVVMFCRGLALDLPFKPQPDPWRFQLEQVARPLVALGS